MSGRSVRIIAMALALVGAAGVQAASFTYDGSLTDQGQPADGIYDFRLSLHPQATGFARFAEPVELHDIRVRDGRFSMPVDLPPAALTDAAWLQVAVRSGDEDYAALATRSPVTAGGTCPAAWTLDGNLVIPLGSFLGTLDSQPLELRVDNQRALRIEPDPVAISLVAGSPANAIGKDVRGAVIAGGGAQDDPELQPTLAPNRVLDAYGTVSGGAGNSAGSGLPGDGSAQFAVVSGGLRNAAAGAAGVIAGGLENSVTGTGAVIGGGSNNVATGDQSVIAGGALNNVLGLAASIGGGGSNATTADFATIAGGVNHVASGDSSSIGGGSTNTASGADSSIAGGFSNVASAAWTSIGGGLQNVAAGRWSVVSGGLRNQAGGEFSAAAGRRAKVRDAVQAGTAEGDAGTYAWADSQDEDLLSTGSNQFLVRAAGGVWFGSASAVTIPAGQFIATDTGAHLSSGGTWTNASSRALKTGFASVDAGDILDALIALPLSTWRYRSSPDEGRHLGPVAEEFAASFGLGAGGESISTVDASGVALAAIQGLNAKLESQNAILAERAARAEAENAQLRREFAALRAELAGIAAALAADARAD